MESLHTSETDAPIGSNRWSPAIDAKSRAAVQRTVDRMLAELAPEKGVTRADRPAPAIDCLRTRRGCILQAATSAVSVSWFPDAQHDIAAGELHVSAWQGTLSQPGATRSVAGATLLREIVLHPAGTGEGPWAWRAADGAVHSGAEVIALCRAMLGAPDGERPTAD